MRLSVRSYSLALFRGRHLVLLPNTKTHEEYDYQPAAWLRLA
jgi:hypothetical protein